MVSRPVLISFLVLITLSTSGVFAQADLLEAVISSLRPDDPSSFDTAFEIWSNRREELRNRPAAASSLALAFGQFGRWKSMRKDPGRQVQCANAATWCAFRAGEAEGATDPAVVGLLARGELAAAKLWCAVSREQRSTQDLGKLATASIQHLEIVLTLPGEPPLPLYVRFVGDIAWGAENLIVAEREDDGRRLAGLTHQYLLLLLKRDGMRGISESEILRLCIGIEAAAKALYIANADQEAGQLMGSALEPYDGLESRPEVSGNALIKFAALRTRLMDRDKLHLVEHAQQAIDLYGRALEQGTTSPPAGFRIGVCIKTLGEVLEIKTGSDPKNRKLAKV